MRSYLLEPPARKLPAADEVTIDRKHYYRQLLHGWYQFNCVVTGDTVRSTKFYIPEGSIYNQPTVFIAVPDDVSAWNFMVASGWKALSDRYGLYLVLMEPKEGKWGKEAEETAYFNALGNDISLRPMQCNQAGLFTANGMESVDADIKQYLIHLGIVAEKPRRSGRAGRFEADIGGADRDQHFDGPF